MPLLVATILVFGDGELRQLVATMALQNAYYFVQLAVVKAFDRDATRRNLTNFAFFLALNYVQIALLFELNPGERNTVGWACICAVGGNAVLISGRKTVAYLRGLYVRNRNERVRHSNDLLATAR